MKEASVLGPFMKKLRQRFKGAEVIKHRDASMTGMVDSSITYGGRTIWFEAKLYALPKKGDPGWEHWRDKAMEESPTQAETVKRIAATSCCLYVIWIKKTCVYIGYPTGEPLRVKDSAQAVERFAILFDNWSKGPMAWKPSLFTT